MTEVDKTGAGRSARKSALRMSTDSRGSSSPRVAHGVARPVESAAETHGEANSCVRSSVHDMPVGYTWG